MTEIPRRISEFWMGGLHLTPIEQQRAAGCLHSTFVILVAKHQKINVGKILDDRLDRLIGAPDM